MDSINTLRGYGKVDHIEDQASQSHHKTTKKPLITIIAISAIVLLTVIIGATFASLVYESNNEPPEFPSLSSNPTEAIKAVCNVTQYPDSCFTSISSSINTTSPKLDPELILKLSLQASVAELSNSSSFLKTLISNPNGPQTNSALKDCQSLFDDALSRLSGSVSAMEVGSGEKVLTEGKVSDIKTWVSAAMTDQETCLDGLEEMGSAALIEVKSKVQKSRVYVSNSLAILAKMDTLLEEFDLTLH